MRTQFFVSLLIVSSLIGCSNDDDNNNDSFTLAGVQEVVFETPSIEVGQETVLAVSFSFNEQDIFTGEDSVFVAVKLPKELSYHNGSAEIDGAFNDDNKVIPQILRCNDGQNILVFDLDSNDLENAAPPNLISDALLTLTVKGILPAQATAVDARADDSEGSVFCNSTFIPQEVAFISIQ